VRTPDVIVVGLGAAGAATLFQLARRGVHAMGIDSYSPPHVLGSTHGDTRITREAIGEGAYYTPLVRRSHVIWRELEAETGADLLTQCGGLVIEAAGGGAAGHHRHDFLSQNDRVRDAVRHPLRALVGGPRSPCDSRSSSSRAMSPPTTSRVRDSSAPSVASTHS